MSSLFSSTARDALAALLRVHGKDMEAAAVLRGDLTKLNLGYRAIGDDGAEIVADFLKHDETVRKVWLYGCHIGSCGVKAMAESLKHNQTLEYLDISDNQIGDECAAALIDSLAHNVFITCALLYSTNVTPESEMTIKFLTETRNKILIPAAVRRASLSLIAARRSITNAGILACFPKEIVKMIAMEVWATCKDPIWIETLSGPAYMGRWAKEIAKKESNHNPYLDSDSNFIREGFNRNNSLYK